MALYVKLDTTFLWNRHMVTVGAFGRLLYIGGLSYCGENLSDGRIPKAVLNRIADVDDKAPAKSAKALVDAGRWDDLGDCWMVHDYEVHQTSSAQVEAKRERWRNQKQKRKADSAPDSAQESTAEQHPESAPESVEIPPTRTQNTEHRTQKEDKPLPQTATAAVAGPKPERPRDDLFDALVVLAEGIPRDRFGSLTKPQSRAIAVAAADIRKAGGDHTTVRTACESFRQQFPGATLTAPALAKHWARLQPGTGTTPQARPAPAAARQGNGATELDKVTGRFVTPAELARLTAERQAQSVSA